MDSSLRMVTREMNKIENIGMRKFIAKIMLTLLRMRILEKSRYAMVALGIEEYFVTIMLKRADFQKALTQFRDIFGLFSFKDFLSESEIEDMRRALVGFFPEEESGLQKHMEEVLFGTAQRLDDPVGQDQIVAPEKITRSITPRYLATEFFSLTREKPFDYEEVFEAVVSYYQKHGYTVMEEEITTGDNENIYSAVKDDEKLTVGIINEGNELIASVCF
jgi:hypothetical protein